MNVIIRLILKGNLILGLFGLGVFYYFKGIVQGIE